MKEQDYSKDAALVIETIESVHPIFLLDDMLAKNYDEIRNAFLSETSKPMAREDFAMAISRYIRVLKDGHMAGRKMRERFNLDVKWAVRDDRLFLLDKDGLPSNKEVVAIGGISVKSIFNAVDKHHFSENYVDRHIVLGQRSRGVWMLKYSGVLMEKTSN